MRNIKTILSLSSGLAFSLLVSGSSVSAQPAGMMVDPNGALAEPAAPAGQPAPAPQQGQGASVGEAGDADNSGLEFYGDYMDGQEYDTYRVRYNGGVVPLTHTVQSGDTLWGLSGYYFNNPWNWPKVWGLNPEVTNPHWIYPGNILRLREGSAQLAAAPTDTGTIALRSAAAAPEGRSIGLQQMAYVDLEELEDAGRIAGAVDDKQLLSTGDSIYISYPKEGVPKIGQRFAVYQTRKKIRRGGKAVGAYVEVTGELEVVTLARDGKRARAVLLRSVRPIERGMAVGPLNLSFSDVRPTTNKQNVDGRIAELIGPDQLIGAQAAIILDRGRDDGVEVGNRFLVVRRGDAYRTELEAGNNVGQNDKRFPARAIGEVMVIQIGKSASMGVVTFSMREFGVGDRVFMRKGK